MLTGAPIKPYPLTCAGDYCTLGGVQHSSAIDARVDKYADTTKVSNPLVTDANGKNPGDDGYITTYLIGGTSGTSTVSPYEVFSQAVQPNCTQPPSTPATPGSWIGSNLFQFSLVSGQVNYRPDAWTHTPGDEVSFVVCYKHGFKNAAAVLQWNGSFGWLSHDPAGCNGTICVAEVDDINGNAPGSVSTDPGQLPLYDPQDYIPTYSSRSYESFSSAPDGMKYLTLTADVSYSHADINHTSGFEGGGETVTTESTMTGSISVNQQSGEIDSTLNTTEDDYYQGDPTNDSDPYQENTQTRHLDGGAGWYINVNPDEPPGSEIPVVSGGTTELDSLGTDVHCYGGICAELTGIVNTWNTQFPLQQLPQVTGESYGSADAPNTVTVERTEINTFISIFWTCTNTVFQWAFIQTQTANAGYEFETLENFNNSGTLTLSDPSPANDTTISGTLYPGIYSDLKYLLGQIPLNDDRLYPWRTDGLLQVAPLVSRNQREANVSPLQGFLPATLDDYRSPTTDANGNAPFTSSNPSPPFGWTYAPDNNDSNGLPYTDPSWLGPADYILTWTQMDWIDLTCWNWQFPVISNMQTDYTNHAASYLIHLYDGSVLGGMKPAGYQNVFCFQFEDWRGCCYNDGEGDSGFDGYIFGFGMFVEDYNAQVGAQLPLNCTQWTDNSVTTNKPPGASLMYCDQTPVNQPSCPDSSATPVARRNNALWGYKYAEIKELWIAENYGEPAGRMKFDYDETNVYCVANLLGAGVGSTWTVTDNTGATPPSLVAGIWGGASVGGFYNIASYVGGVVTLGALAYNLPSDWASRSGDDATCFGLLRWPAYPSLLGRQRISMAALTASFAAAQTSFGMAVAGTEQVDVYDANMTLLAGNVTATRVTDATFTLPANYPLGMWVTITGVNYEFNSNYPRGSFVALDWTFDFRTQPEVARGSGVTDCDGNNPPSGWPTTPSAGQSGYNNMAAFSQTEYCLPAIKCAPAVMCWSPNGEEFDNGVTLPFPGTFNCDERYGSKWQGYFQQVMTALLAEAPHRPCGLDPGIAWTMDDGSCNEDGDTVKYFPLLRQVEAAITLPDYGFGSPQTDVPTLPSGITLGWLSPLYYSGAGVAYPPGAIGYLTTGFPAAIDTPWALKVRLCSATADDSSCRFETEYAEFTIGCYDD